MDENIKEILEDIHEDGRAKKKNKEKAKELLKNAENSQKRAKTVKWVYEGQEYDKLTDIDVENHNELINRGIINRKG